MKKQNTFIPSYATLIEATFQCKRHQGSVISTGDIRDFRGSLTKNIEKGIFITTGSFSKNC